MFKTILMILLLFVLIFTFVNHPEESIEYGSVVKESGEKIIEKAKETYDNFSEEKEEIEVNVT